MRIAVVACAAIALLAACGEKHEPVKVIARPPPAQRPALPPAPAENVARAVEPAAPASRAASATATATPGRLPPPPALAPPARVHQAGEPTGNDAFRAAIDAKFRAGAR